jgi:hypothetical protein
MNNTLISAIRVGLFAGVLFFALASDVFAAPVLTPATVTTVSETTATLSAKVTAPQLEKATVWFEWGDTASSSTAVGLRTIFETGFFEADLRDLRPNTIYYFRAVAMQGGVTVSSLTTSFTTKGPVVNTVTKIPPPTTTVVQNTKTVFVTVPATTTPALITATKETPSSSQGASAIGAGSVLPGTLIGWVALLISIFIVLLIVLMILEASEKRKKKPIEIFQEGDGDETV